MRRSFVVIAACLLASPAFANPPALASYINKDPREAVRGVSFLRHPTVLAGIAKAVPEGYVRTWVLTDNDDAMWQPITRQSGYLVAYACEHHMCGPHNWTLMIDPASGAAKVCNYDEEGSGKGEGKTGQGKVRWYYSSGQSEVRDGDQVRGGCPTRL
jgi:hypothetical protein